MIENHMVLETAQDRAREAAAEQAERALDQEYQDAATEIEQIIIDDAAKTDPRKLLVPYVDHRGFMVGKCLSDVFEDMIADRGIDVIFHRLMQTDAAKELREAIARKYIELNAVEIAEARAA